MNSLNNVNLVKRTVGLVGFLASAAIVLPVAAQVKPATESPAPDAQMPAVESQTPEVQTPASGDPQSPTLSVPAQPQSAPSEAEAPTSNTPAPAPAVAATSGTIVDIASASDSFQTLVAALTEAELAEVLAGEGPFTVFAPTDEAFAALPEGTVEELLKPENRERLVTILKYHVVSGAYPSSSLSSGEVPTVAGSPVMVDVSEGQVTVNGANVIQPDITATNGVIHVIDRVILPPQ
ncbi:fasciclin domain-containing protein [Leptolyngbya sp. NK1-12]|nr:fasciclin domain-containing protein [Leptolyngbya sp. NK1-12]